MNMLYELCCLGTGPTVTASEIHKANFQQLLSKTLKAAKQVMHDDELKQEATARLKTVVGSKSHSASNTLRTIRSMFDAALEACEFERERSMVEWLQTCVSTAVEMGLNEATGHKQVKRPVKEEDKDEDEAVVPDSHRHPSGASDDEYVPSEEDQLVPSSKPIQRRKQRVEAQVEMLRVLDPGSGSKAVVQHLAAQASPSSVLKKGYFVKSYFFPSKDSFNAFLSVLNSAQSTIDCCVFSLTDDDVADALIAAKKRKVKIRIITDNQQAAGKGADAERLQRDHGIPYKTDHTTGYMHNKFAIVDGATLINGSFNWSKGARFKNRENIIITNIPECIEDFQRQFDTLWQEF